MIDTKELTESDKGKEVRYTSYGREIVEYGVITSWNDQYVFVEYLGERHSKATDPRTLEFTS